MKPIFPSITIVILIWACCSCNKETSQRPLNGCDTANTIFSQLYNNLLSSPGINDDTTMDLHVHSYTFQVSSPETLCKVGYQNLSPTNTSPYLIEIYDSTSHVLLYRGTHSFSSANISYIPVNAITLTPGNSYTVKRIQNMTSNASDLIGRMILNYNSQIVFPVILNNLTITSSSFENSTSPPNPGLPYIDLVFE